MPAQITIEEAAPCVKKFTVEFSAEETASEHEKILKEFQKFAQLPGFRVGHAPASIVRQKFAKTIEEQLKKKLVPQGYQQALNSHHLRVIGEPLVEKVEYIPGGPLRFTVAVETAPHFELPPYKGLTVEVEKAAVTDADVQQTLELLQEQHAHFVDVTDRPAKMGDFLVIDFFAVADGKSLTEYSPHAKPISEAQDFWLLLQHGSFLPNFCQQLVGVLREARQQVFVDFPADFALQELAGRKATYFVQVKAIKQKNLAALDDAFAALASNGQHQTLESLRDAIRDSISRRNELRSAADARNKLAEALMAQVNFELPPALLAQETRDILHEIVQHHQQRGATRQQIEQRKEELVESARRSAVARIKSTFILQKIAEAEQITVTPQELNARIEQMAARHRMAPAQLKKQLDEQGALDEIEQDLLIGKALELVLQHATVKYVEPTQTKQQPWANL
jgi:trigger factor